MKWNRIEQWQDIRFLLDPDQMNERHISTAAARAAVPAEADIPPRPPRDPRAAPGRPLRKLR